MTATPELRYPGPADVIGLPDAACLHDVDPRAAARLAAFCASLRLGHERGLRVAHSPLAPGGRSLEAFDDDLAVARCLAAILRPGADLRRRLRRRFERADASIQAFGGPLDRERLDRAGAMLDELERFADSVADLVPDEHRPTGAVLWGAECILDSPPGTGRRWGLTFERCSWDWAVALHWPDEQDDPVALFPRILGFAELSDPNRTLSAFLAWHADDGAATDAEIRTVAGEGIASDYLLACWSADDRDGFIGRLIAGLGTGTVEALAEDYPSLAGPEFRRDVLRLGQSLPEALDVFGLPRGPKRLRKLIAAEMRAVARRRHRHALDRAEERRIERRRVEAAEPRPPDRFPPRCTVRSMTPLDRARLLAWLRTLPGVIDARIAWGGAKVADHYLRIEWRTAAGPQHVDLSVHDRRPLRDVLGERRAAFPREEIFP